VESSVREATFSSCSFSNCDLSRASITLNRFSACGFSATDFANCTALFIFFDDCSFQSCRINAESLGFTYGLSRDDLGSIELIHLGEKQEKPDGELIEALVSTYATRHWYIGAAALALNFQLEAPVIVIFRLSKQLSSYIAEAARTDWDELQFFTRVLSRLFDEERLPFAALWSFSRLVDLARRRMNSEFPFAEGFAPAPELVLSQLQQMLEKCFDIFAELFDEKLGRRKKAVGFSRSGRRRLSTS
jgi:hypothetical protein